MVKKVEITDSQYDWLMARGWHKKTISVVLVEVINKVILIEKDQAKYKAWIAAGIAKNEAEKTKEGEKGGGKDEKCLESGAD